MNERGKMGRIKTQRGNNENWYTIRDLEREGESKHEYIKQRKPKLEKKRRGVIYQGGEKNDTKEKNTSKKEKKKTIAGGVFVWKGVICFDIVVA